MSHESTEPTAAAAAAAAPSAAAQARAYWRGWALLCRSLAEMQQRRGNGRVAAGLYLQANQYQRQAGAAGRPSPRE